MGILEKILIFIVATIAALFALGCVDSNKNNQEPSRPDITDVEYYGCPNSKRIKKLNLKKTKKM